VLEDPELAGRLVTAGRERAAAFDWSVVLPAIEDVYARALQTGPASLR
jgi:glycosyltransferase involved in cell wall biosynthesis